MDNPYATNIKHGMHGTPEYNAWRAMKARCKNPKHKQYEGWGGRGIAVCSRWNDDFAAFYNDMGDKPSSAHSIDRIDNDGDYMPDNCRWATLSQQNRNKRVPEKNAAGVKGVRFNNQAGKWIAQITINGKQYHLGRHADIHMAINARRLAEKHIGYAHG